MPGKHRPWSEKTGYRSPSKTEIKNHFGKNIYEVPGGSTLEDIIRYLDRYWPEKTLDLENCVLLPRNQKEILFHELGLLPSDTENIIYSDEKDWSKYGSFWEIRPEEFNNAGSNLLKDAWSRSLRKRKDFLEKVKKSRVDDGIPFEPRFRYDAVEQVDNGIYNVLDYIAIMKGGAKFYNDHCRGKHFEIEPDGNNRWIAKVPSDKLPQGGQPEKIYEVIIEYPEKKQRVLRYYTGSCECPDYRSKKRKNVNPICKHQISSVPELAGHGVELDEILPFPTEKALILHEKADCLLYRGGKTDTSKDAIIRAYIDCKINDISAIFTTNPAYARNLHRGYHTFSI